jgi:3-oxoacyl-[acyl-carrier protein] reductase
VGGGVSDGANDGTMPRRALVTGTSTGIGRATALKLAAQGYALWITYTTGEAAARETAQACTNAAEVHVSRLDLRSPEAIASLVGEIEGAWSELHVLVNNGAVCPYVTFDAIEIDEWDAVLETNARGTFLLTRAALPLLRAAAGDRSIVNVSSVAAQIGAISTAMHYAASKAAILAITRSFARILAPEGIRVNAVAPGPIETATTARLAPEVHDRLEQVIPLGRFGEPRHVAETIALLASPASAFTTGATYDVNGGVRID